MNMQDVTDLVISEGDVRTIHDSSNNLLWGKLNYDTKYAGDTVQNGTPTPDAPVAVQTVTGEQTVTISDGVSLQSYPISLASIELCKIGDYQDYIYKSDNDWYVHKATGNVTLTGSETDWEIKVNTAAKTAFIHSVSDIENYTDLNAVPRLVSNRYIPQSYNGSWLKGVISRWISTNNQIALTMQAGLSVDDFKTWLASNNTDVYYVLATATDTKITDATLISQLDDIHEWLTRYGYNSTVSGTLPLIVSQTNLS